MGINSVAFKYLLLMVLDAVEIGIDSIKNPASVKKAISILQHAVDVIQGAIDELKEKLPAEAATAKPRK